MLNTSNQGCLAIWLSFLNLHVGLWWKPVFKIGRIRQDAPDLDPLMKYYS